MALRAIYFYSIILRDPVVDTILSTISTEVAGGLVSQLVDLGWDDRISSCCFTGFWILYAEENWNDEGGTVHKPQCFVNTNG